MRTRGMARRREGTKVRRDSANAGVPLLCQQRYGAVGASAGARIPSRTHRRANPFPLSTALTRAAIFTLIPIALVCGTGLQQTPSSDEPPPTIESLLRDVEIDPRDVGIHANDLAFLVGTRPRSELTQLLMTEPLRADGLGHVIAQLLLYNPDAEEEADRRSIIDILGSVSRLNTRVVRRGLIGDPLEKHKKAAEEKDALQKALRACGAAQLPTTQLNALPDSVQQAAALLLLTAADSAKWIEQSWAAADEAFWARVERELREPLKTGAEEEQEEEDLDELGFAHQYKRAVESFPTQWVMVAAQNMLLAVEHAQQVLGEDDKLEQARFDLRIQTDLGWVALADSRRHEHEYGGPVLLIIDVGGDDKYANAGANADRRHPVSVAIDLAGGDNYQAAHDAVGSFGAGVLGVGILCDLGGNDRYDGQRRSQGAGEFGVGVLIDSAGNDSYIAVQSAQASATAGYGLLIDRAGDDRYESFVFSQAFAGPNASAALIDVAGHDHYMANDSDIRFPSSQDKEHNSSMSQAAASGWRADYTDGESVNGGVAVLLDADGDDKYSCGVFGQGVGYWYGAGLLIDLAGNDRYRGHWHVQGVSTHFAAGLLLDRGGDDEYVANQNMAQGAGHDVGVGVLIDDAGHDTYVAPTLSLGASNAAGVGLFIDKAGDDEYRTPASACLGWVNKNRAYRALFRSYGLFFDLSGRDTYAGHGNEPGRKEARDGKSWTTPPDKDAPVPYMFGFAFDVYARD
jgi:hypothetical protein